MENTNVSETITENIFREFYGANTFIEKSAIPNYYGFKSKKGTSYKGYPDFFLDDVNNDYVIIVEAKAIEHSEAEAEVKFYIDNNSIKNKDIVGIAISGQDISQVKITYYIKLLSEGKIIKLNVADVLFPLSTIKKKYNKYKNGETISDDELIKTIKELNEKFHQGNKIRDTQRSLFFSGIMIALTNANFRSTYKFISEPRQEEIITTSAKVLKAHNMNKAIIDAIDSQLKAKINNLSKEFSWKDTFSFIKNVDFELKEYIEIIKLIETKIFQPYQNDEKLDILGRAYKIFLSRAGKVDNKNIILTPDHIKTLMVKLARLNLNDVIIDTCTGSGGFLMEAMERLISLAKENTDVIDDIHNNKLIGFEIDPVLFSLSCSNMFLHGDGRTNLLYRSSLLNESKSIVNSSDKELLDFIRKMKPTKCIINPPYENNLPIHFTLSAIDYLEPNGKLIIIMPTPTLTKNLKNGLTKQLLEKAKLDFVIKCPKNLFSEQNRRVNTSIFGFTKTPHQMYDETLFCYMEDDGFVSVQKKGRIDKKNKWNDIENRILDIINNVKNVNEISEKRKIFSEENDDIKIVPYGIQNRKLKSNMVKFCDIFAPYIKGTLASESVDDEECKGNIDFITAAPEWRKCDEAEHDCEAIVYIVASDGCLGRSHYVNGKFTACNLSIVLKQKKDSKYEINMRFYAYYLNRIKDKIVKDLEDGTSKMTINPDLLMDYYIDYIPIDEQNKFVNEFIIPCNELETKYKKALATTDERILELV